MRLWEKFKAWRRGERMVPGVNRGRCFVKKNGEDTPAGGVKNTKAKAKAELVGIKIIRADGTKEVIK